MSSIAAGIGLPRSRASSVVPALRPPSGALATDEHSSRVEAEHVSVAAQFGVSNVDGGVKVGVLGVGAAHP
jgi:hypothetical protein